MKRKRFTEEQIIGMLKQAEAGAKTADLCRQAGITSSRQSLTGKKQGISWIRPRIGGIEAF